MPKSPNPNLNPDNNYNLNVRIPGWMKLEIIELCEKNGWSIQQWASVRLLVALREGQGVPPAPRGLVPLPTTADQIRAYAQGERLLGPCGGVWPCGFVESDVTVVSGVEFCGSCGVRV
jgi:hypothetical protein